MRIFSGGVKTAGVAEEYSLAVQIAESLMAKTGSEIPLKNHQSAGVADEKYHWEVNIVPYRLNSAGFDTKAANAELFKINVNVNWGEGNDDRRSLQLATLKLLTKNNALQ